MHSLKEIQLSSYGSKNKDFVCPRQLFTKLRLFKTANQNEVVRMSNSVKLFLLTALYFDTQWRNCC